MSLTPPFHSCDVSHLHTCYINVSRAMYFCSLSIPSDVIGCTIIALILAMRWFLFFFLVAKRWRRYNWHYRYDESRSRFTCINFVACWVVGFTYCINANRKRGITRVYVLWDEIGWSYNLVRLFTNSRDIRRLNYHISVNI